MSKNFTVTSVQLVSKSEKLFSVMTKTAGGFVVSSDVEVGDDARECEIIRECESHEDAAAWFKKAYNHP